MTSEKAGIDSPPHEYRASLRVSSQTLHLSDVAARLGEPSHSHDIGDPVSKHSPEIGERRDAMWIRESTLDRSRPLDHHIEELVVFAEANRAALDALRDVCEIDIFCGVFTGSDGQGGFTIEPTLSARLAELSLPVGFDIY